MTPSLYESTLANTLLQNADTKRVRHDTYHNPAVPVDETELTLCSVEESFTAMIDDLLVAFGASQLVLGQSSAPVTISAQMSALQIGKQVYIFWCLALNLVLLLCVLEEAWRNDLWKQLHSFDFLDLESLIYTKVERKTKNDVLLRIRDERRRISKRRNGG
jgi:hypothetical protein